MSSLTSVDTQEATTLQDQSPSGWKSSPDQRAGLCERLWDMRDEGLYCDIILEVGGQSINAHKVILVAGSPFLHTSITELNHSGGKVILKINDLSPKTCLKLLKFIYTGSYPDDQDEGFNHGFRKWLLDTAFSIHAQEERLGEIEFDSSLDNDELKKCAKLTKPEVGNSVGMKRKGAHSRRKVTKRSAGERARYKSTKKIKTGQEENLGNKADISLDGHSVGETKLCLRTRSRHKEKLGTPPGGDLVLKNPSHRKSTDDFHEAFVKREALEKNTLAEKCETAETKPTYNTSDNIIDTLSEQDHVKVKSDIDSDAEESSSLTLDISSSLSEKLVKRETRNETKLKRLKKGRKGEKMVTNGRTRHRCGYCGSEYSTMAELKVHRAEDHRQNKKAEAWCTLCKLKFNGRNLLLAHNMERHWAEGMELPKLYTCNKPGCDFTTYVQGTWYAHMSHMHNKEPIVCEICGRSYKHKFSLSSHMRHAHGPQKEFPCDSEECKRVFASCAGLRNHRKLVHTHELRQPHICPHCGHTCLSQSTLSEHLYTKHDILPKGREGHECKYCDFKTLTVSVLNRHQSRHSVDRPYKCDTCDKTYTDRNQLKYHQIKHDTSAKMYQCEHCTYSTKYMQHYKDHVQIRHEKKDHKPFSCDECSYRCNSRGNLYKHLRKVHKRVVETKQKLSKVPDSSLPLENSQIAENAATNWSINQLGITQTVEESGAEMVLTSLKPIQEQQDSKQQPQENSELQQSAVTDLQHQQQLMQQHAGNSSRSYLLQPQQQDQQQTEQTSLIYQLGSLHSPSPAPTATPSTNPNSILQIPFLLSQPPLSVLPQVQTFTSVSQSHTLTHAALTNVNVPPTQTLTHAALANVNVPPTQTLTHAALANVNVPPTQTLTHAALANVNVPPTQIISSNWTRVGAQNMMKKDINDQWDNNAFTDRTSTQITPTVMGEYKGMNCVETTDEGKNIQEGNVDGQTGVVRTYSYEET